MRVGGIDWSEKSFARVRNLVVDAEQGRGSLDDVARRMSRELGTRVVAGDVVALIAARAQLDAAFINVEMRGREVSDKLGATLRSTREQSAGHKQNAGVMAVRLQHATRDVEVGDSGEPATTPKLQERTLLQRVLRAVTGKRGIGMAMGGVLMMSAVGLTGCGTAPTAPTQPAQQERVVSRARTPETERVEQEAAHRAAVEQTERMEAARAAAQEALRQQYADEEAAVKVALAKVMRFATQDSIDVYAGPIARAMREFDINTPERKAAFLAQIGHESGDLKYAEEIATGSQYEGRDDLGNTHRGDGRRYKGRGLIQLTGRTNYRECGKALGLDLERDPFQVMDPELSARVAGWYWKTNGLNELADKGRFVEITEIINGGRNGLKDRKAHYVRALDYYDA